MKKSEIKERIIALIENNPGMDAFQIAKLMGMSVTTVNFHLVAISSARLVTTFEENSLKRRYSMIPESLLPIAMGVYRV